ncbi:hypothetical protein HPB50_016809 [Hyalomma asiaticum]|uniref:Uncharacterized protein n=1 Tax=Hyalomma asiaticum TaxID=266040 RepID=A0ACB7SI38_HYAAI|nr:hypothetical protein HPB50_016809 [Hyalomma asiaticum]
MRRIRVTAARNGDDAVNTASGENRQRTQCEDVPPPRYKDSVPRTTRSHCVHAAVLCALTNKSYAHGTMECRLEASSDRLLLARLQTTGCSRRRDPPEDQ